MTNSSYRWVIVAAGGLLGCMAIGAMFSLPVFLLPISRQALPENPAGADASSMT